MQVPDALMGRYGEPARTFLGLDEASTDFDEARAVVLPVPYEATTSYGGGAGRGPAAILEASRHVELYDQELDREPCEVGIATLPALRLTRAGPAPALEELRAAYGGVLDAARDGFVVLLGGEHTISSVPIHAWADRLEAAGAGRRLSVLQIDAHTDLRPEYQGTPHSHASVMHGVHDRVELVAAGVRALSRGERRLVRASDSIHVFFADDIHRDAAWIDAVVERLGDDVYISVDVDAFDPSVLPATGTPEPGGLTWYPVLELLRRVFRERTVHGCDVVELAPIPGQPASDVLAAKLVYKMIGYRFFA